MPLVETFDVHVTRHFVVRWFCVLVLPLGVGRQALHTPSPRLSLQQRRVHRRRRDCTSGPPPHNGDEEGLHFRPSSSHCGCFRDKRAVPASGNGCLPGYRWQCQPNLEEYIPICMAVLQSSRATSVLVSSSLALRARFHSDRNAVHG